MERRLFNHPFLHPQSTITIYLGKIGLSIDQIGNGERLCGYMVWETPFRDWLAYQIKRIWYDRIKMWGRGDIEDERRKWEFSALSPKEQTEELERQKKAAEEWKERIAQIKRGLAGAQPKENGHE